MTYFYQQRYNLLLLLSIFLALVFRAILVNSFYPINFLGNTLYIFDLFSIEGIVSPFVLFFSSIGSMLLIYLTVERLFNKKVAIISVLLYGISPWIAYLDVYGSFYNYLLFWLLLFIYGLVLVSNQIKRGIVYLMLGYIILSLSSVFIFPIATLMLLICHKEQFLSVRLFKKCIIMFFLILTTLIILIILNPLRLINIIQRDVTILSDVGIINSVNQLRGELQDSNLLFVGKIVENRYLYISQQLVYTSLKHLVPSTYFTSQEKLLNFSISPPVFIGFLVPLIYGIGVVITFWKKHKTVFIIPLLLMIPSILSKYSPDLARLVLISPILFLTISLGLVKMKESSQKFTKILLVLSLSLVVIQFLTTISDIIIREPIRSGTEIFKYR